MSSSEQSDEQELKSRLFFTVSASMKLESKSAESEVLRSDDSSSSSLISPVDSRVFGRRHRQLASSSSPSSRIADSPSNYLVPFAGNQLLQPKPPVSPRKPSPPTSPNFNVIFRQFSIYNSIHTVVHSMKKNGPVVNEFIILNLRKLQGHSNLSIPLEYG